MKISSVGKNVDTKQFGYSIIVPTEKNSSVPTLYKVFFGTHYFIWKGKALLQSCEILAKSISATLSRMNKGELIKPSDQLYHVVKHIKSKRVDHATVEVISNDYIDENDVINGLQILKDEQRLLDESGDHCLNNNEQSYVPLNNIWISEETKQKFLRWYPGRNRSFKPVKRRK